MITKEWLDRALDGLLPSGKPSLREAMELYNFADSFYKDVLEMFNR
jgi:hypothetical protein